MEAFFKLASAEHRALQECRTSPRGLSKESTADLFRKAIRENRVLLETALDEYYAERGIDAQRRDDLIAARRDADVLRAALEQLVGQEIVTVEQLRTLVDSRGEPLLQIVDQSPSPQPPPPPPAGKRRIAPRLIN